MGIMDKVTRLEKIADSFIDTWLIDHPIMVYSLDIELNEYLENVHEIKDTNLCNDILRNTLEAIKIKRSIMKCLMMSLREINTGHILISIRN
jgi:hypothetical protein